MALSWQTFLFGFIIFWLGLFLLARWAKLAKYGLFIGPFVLLFRTEKLNYILKKIGRKHPRAIILLGRIAVPTSFFLLVSALVLFTGNLYLLFFSKTGGFGIIPVIPGITIDLEQFLFFIIPLGLAILVHELAHGVMATAEELPLRSTGLILLGVLFGAFVEIDEKAEFEASTDKLQRVLAIGVLANILMALLFVPIFFGANTMTEALYDQGNGVLVVGVQPGSAAYDAGIRKGWVVEGVIFTNGTFVATPTVNSLVVILSSLLPGEDVILQCKQGYFGMKTPDYVDRKGITGGRFGLSLYQYYEPKFDFLSPWLPYIVESEILLIINFNLMLGLFNVLPLVITDGDKVMRLALKKSDHAKLIMMVLRIGSLAVISLNIFATVFQP